MDARGSWPAFYARGESVLWVNVAGSVNNGGWRPTFSEDRLECWADRRCHRRECLTNPDCNHSVFEWAAPAPMSGHYNDVIGLFQDSRGRAGYWVRRRVVRVVEDADIVTRVGALADYVTAAGGLVVDPREARRFPDMYQATVGLGADEEIEFVPA